MRKSGRSCNTSVHLPKGMVTETWDDNGDGVPGVIEATAVLMEWVALIIKMETRICVVKNRNEYRMFLSLVTWQG